MDGLRRTIDSYLTLKALTPSVPWVPVLQGWAHEDYLRHLRMYDAAGIDVGNFPTVGLGSVCRRQKTKEAVHIVRDLHARGLRLHGFGFKLTGLRACARWLVSADSMAWSYDARRKPPMPGHTHGSCANCWEYARAWRDRVVGMIREAEARPVQCHLFDGMEAA